MRVDRDTFIAILESVAPGTSKKDIVEQSSCLVFKDGRVMTFNDEIACTMELPKGVDLTGAVAAEPVLQLLRKMPDDVLSLELVDDVLNIKGKGRRAEMRMEAEVTLPIDSVDVPTDWRDVPDGFIEAMEMAQGCTQSSGKDASFMLTCIHITPKHIEACDNFQIVRCPVDTGLAGPTLVRRDSVQGIKAMNVDAIGETDTWIHFRDVTGMVMSCRRYNDEFPTLDDMLLVDGTSPMQLPPALAEAVERAAVFSAENAEDSAVSVRMKASMIEVKGVGSTGRFTERKAITYNGPPVAFKIAPVLLNELVAKHTEAEVSETRLVVDGGNFRYVTCLGKVE